MFRLAHFLAVFFVILFTSAILILRLKCFIDRVLSSLRLHVGKVSKPNIECRAKAIGFSIFLANFSWRSGWHFRGW